jgi:hypothetical protein
MAAPNADMPDMVGFLVDQQPDQEALDEPSLDLTPAVDGTAHPVMMSHLLIGLHDDMMLQEELPPLVLMDSTTDGSSSDDNKGGDSGVKTHDNGVQLDASLHKHVDKCTLNPPHTVFTVMPVMRIPAGDGIRVAHPEIEPSDSSSDSSDSEGERSVSLFDLASNDTPAVSHGNVSDDISVDDSTRDNREVQSDTVQRAFRLPMVLTALRSDVHRQSNIIRVSNQWAYTCCTNCTCCNTSVERCTADALHC